MPTSSLSDGGPQRQGVGAKLACSAADRYVNQEMHCATSGSLQRMDRYLTADAKRFTPTPRMHKCQAKDCCDNQILYDGA